MHYAPEYPLIKGKKVWISAINDQPGKLGRPHVRIRIYDTRSRWLPLQLFHGRGAKARSALVEDGLPFCDDGFKELQQQVHRDLEFKPSKIIDHVGWNRKTYALADGDFRQKHSDKSVAFIFKPDLELAPKGNQGDWLNSVADPLSGHSTAEFCMMVPFAGPLLKFSPVPHNFGFELAGSRATGKTSIANLASTVWGPIDRIVLNMNATANAIDDNIGRRRDGFFTFEEWTMFTLSPGRKGATESSKLVFRLSGKKGKTRSGKKNEEESRFVWLSSSNQPSPDLFQSLGRDAGEAALDRMLTIMIDPVERSGIFSHLTDGETIGSKIGPMVSAAERNHGTAIRAFLKHVVGLMDGHNRKEFHGLIRDGIDKFAQAALDRGLCATERVLNSFGLVAVAGQIAIDCGALPSSYAAHEAALEALGRHIRARRGLVEPVEMLRAIARSNRTLDLRNQNRRATPEEVEAYDAFIHSGRCAEELVIMPSQLEALPVDSKRLIAALERQNLLKPDNAHKKTYRQIVEGWPRKRVVAVRLDGLMDDD